MQHQDTSKKQPAGQSPGQPRSSQPHAADPWSTKRSGSLDNPKDSHASGDIAGAASHAYDRLEDAGGEVRDHLERIARDGRKRIAGEIRTVSEAANAAAERLSDEDHDRIGGYVRGIRRQCDRAAQYLEQHDVQSLMRDMNGVARRNPALIIGGAAVLSLVAGRFLSARSPRQRDGDEGDWDSPYSPSQAGWGQEQRWPEARGQYERQPSTTGVGGGLGANPTSPAAGSVGRIGAGAGRPVGGTTGRPLGGTAAGSTGSASGSSSSSTGKPGEDRTAGSQQGSQRNE